MPHCTELMIMKFEGLEEDQVYENELLLVESQAYEEEQEHQELVASQAYKDEEESLRDKYANMQSEDFTVDSLARGRGVHNRSNRRPQ